MRIGTNLANNGYDYSSPQFADMVKQGSPFYAHGEHPGNPGHRADGYPNWADGDNRWYSILGLGYAFPAGDYTVIADGIGTVRFQDGHGAPDGGLLAFDGSGRTQKVPCFSGAGPNTGDLTWFQILDSFRTNPVRNVRIYPPGIAPGTVFHPEFLEALRLYAVLRFMDWGKTNFNKITRWADRPTLGQHNWHDVKPYELMFDLCNLTGNGCWICIPTRADEDHVRQLAAMANERLDPALELYAEYSNETWNFGFADTFDYFLEWGPANGNPGDWQSAAILAGRALDAFKKATRPDRKLIRVLGAQTWNPGNLHVQYDVLTSQGFDVDAFAGAPYVSAGAMTTQNSLEAQAMDLWRSGDKEGAMARLWQGMKVNLDDTLVNVAAFKAHADLHNKRLINYECGQHLTAGGGGWPGWEDYEAMYAHANRHHGMRIVYGDYLPRMKAAGVDLSMHFYDAGGMSKWGSWGAKEYTSQPDAETPKHRAIISFITSQEPTMPRFVFGPELAEIEYPKKNLPAPVVTAVSSTPDGKVTMKVDPIAPENPKLLAIHVVLYLAGSSIPSDAQAVADSADKHFEYDTSLLTDGGEVVIDTGAPEGRWKPVSVLEIAS